MSNAVTKDGNGVPQVNGEIANGTYYVSGYDIAGKMLDSEIVK